MLATALILSLSLPAQEDGMPADLAAYMQEIRDSGMTEDARGAISMVAGILVGETTLSFPKDEKSGQYGNSYSSAFCLKPGLPQSEIARIRQEAAQKKAPVIARLKVIADSDCSGFVSSKEGRELRSVVEFGLKLAFLLKNEGPDVAKLQKLLHISPEAFSAKVTAYCRVVAQLSDLPSVHAPSIPISLGDAPGKTGS
jgi:hypothetical protein